MSPAAPGQVPPFLRTNPVRVFPRTNPVRVFPPAVPPNKPGTGLPRSAPTKELDRLHDRGRHHGLVAAGDLGSFAIEPGRVGGADRAAVVIGDVGLFAAPEQARRAREAGGELER